MKQDINNVNWLTDKAAFVVIFMIQCALTLQLINMAICICGIGSVELETVVFIHFFNRRNPIPRFICQSQDSSKSELTQGTDSDQQISS